MTPHRLFHLPTAAQRDPAVEAWLSEHTDPLGVIAQRWFALMRDCGDDVREVMHDGYPTACVGDAAFAYVGVFKAHINVGFFNGTEIPDPAGLLEGAGKFMRHVKLWPAVPVDEVALRTLIQTSYRGMKAHLAPG
ncbi:MAG: hypothetical protein A3H44_06415 [Gammaproteobacteria bacterium RIFCSPLOWO2_02_FULL_57_10]|nr:MAG: hypothetical protein A3H44_06415 [Gammaproteobacteria bacterium RIFCSPLOWO2_02_FULL_57_10]